ncbi:MAG: von Willebrand factor type A domain-containing protein [Planctomycetaceae bacterium]
MTTDDRRPERSDRPESVDPREETASLLTALALDELAGEERERLVAMLAQAGAAPQRRHVEEARALAALLRAGRPAGRPTAAVRAAVIAALEARRATAAPEPGPATRPASSSRRRWPWLVALGAVAASLLTVVAINRPSEAPRQVAKLAPPPRAEASAPASGGDESRVVATATGAASATRAAGAATPASSSTDTSSLAAAATDGPAPQASAEPAAPTAAVPPVLETAGKGLVFGFRGGVSGAARSDGAVPGAATVSESLAANEAPREAGASTAGGANPAASRGTTGGAPSVAAGGGRFMSHGAVPSAAPTAPGITGSEALLDEVRASTVMGIVGPAVADPPMVPDRFPGPRPGGGRGAGGERYARFVENPFLDPQAAPLSTFSVDVDTASYAIVRRFLTAGRRPPPDAVRLEEMLNTFRYADPPPAVDGDPFAVRLETAACPWKDGHRLVRIGIKGREIAAAARPAGNLVFLIDVSGSMRDGDKLPLVKQALGMLVDRLREDDTVSIVTYAGAAGLRLSATGGHRPDVIRGAIDSLHAGGSTHGSAGIAMAYDEARKHFITRGINRVILCTDGDLNVGITDDEELVALVRERAREGTFLTVLGFGQGNLQDEKMEKLADRGNGLYAYVDSLREARKVLVEQLTGSTMTIAKDVKIQVEFNPAHVASYRLLGYENRVMAARDFADDAKDAGDIGAGHGVTALYEYVPTVAADAPAGLKYQPRRSARPRASDDPPASPELLTVKLRFKEPAADVSVVRELPLIDGGGSFDSASDDLRFAAAVASFGMLLRDSAHAGTATLSQVAEVAGGALGDDPGGLRAEFLDLVRRAAGAAGGDRD